MVAQAWSARLESGGFGSTRQERSHDRSSNLTPEQRIKELELQLQVMRQKAQFFESVVDVLKNDYGVSIVKKRPGKSSRKSKLKD
jgi:hypothetical protein